MEKSHYIVIFGKIIVAAYGIAKKLVFSHRYLVVRIFERSIPILTCDGQNPSTCLIFSGLFVYWRKLIPVIRGGSCGILLHLSKNRNDSGLGQECQIEPSNIWTVTDEKCIFWHFKVRSV